MWGLTKGPEFILLRYDGAFSITAINDARLNLVSELYTPASTYNLKQIQIYLLR